MGTNAKFIFGFTDHQGYWIITRQYFRRMDGYSEAVLPALKEHTSSGSVDIESFNEAMEYDSWKLEEIPEEEFYLYGQMNYHYYIDEGSYDKILVTVLKEDSEFYRKYGVSNMVVEQELVL